MKWQNNSILVTLLKNKKVLSESINFIRCPVEKNGIMRVSLFIFCFLISLASLQAQVIHKIENGETLYRVARRFGISVKSLMDANGISDPTSVKVGTILRIPGKDGGSSSSVRSSSQAVSASTHRVVSGDTYYSIARKYNLSVNQLLDANGRTDKTVLKVGEVLSLTGSSSTAADVVVTSHIASSRSISSSMPVISNLTWPVSGRMVKHDGKQGGVKIQLSSPQDVRAVASGTVVYHGRYRELGPIVLVEHEGGYIYIYAGVSSSMLKVGDRVAVGDILGRTTSGRDVVFSVFKDANPIDPKDAPRV